MDLFGDAPVAIAAAAGSMNDYQLIQSNSTDRRLTPEETVAWHNQSVQKIAKARGVSFGEVIRDAVDAFDETLSAPDEWAADPPGNACGG